MYIGNKGYTIKKNLITASQIKKIKKDLTVKPFIPPNCCINVEKKFFIFRESTKKLYIPRFYGFDHFGIPDKNISSDGLNINLKFNGDMRDYQTKIINEWLVNTKNYGCGLIEASPGAGKTVIAAKLISILKKKTLIIVHKEFLLRQWKERIQQFLPDATIGLIQGPIIDVENKDIVIGMLQSLSMKDYDLNIFKQFGLTVADEVHRTSAECFSNVFFKVVSKYMIGLSGTMERTDGLSKVFKMFMGPIVTTWKREYKDNTIVNVEAIEYISKDVKYNNLEFNYRKQINYVKMISKIVEYLPRNEFILYLLEQKWKERGGQFIVIGHRKSQLSYIYNNIKKLGFATVGYYIGGMKEQQLKITEKKNIIIATYKMAEEGLDIKTLNTICMITPKKDVRQSVGRIMRSNGDKLIIDIIDTHDNFKKYWIQRRRWYSRNKFNIKLTNNSNFYNNIWENLPNKVFKKKNKKKEPYENLIFGKCLV